MLTVTCIFWSIEVVGKLSPVGASRMTVSGTYTTLVRSIRNSELERLGGSSWAFVVWTGQVQDDLVSALKALAKLYEL